MSEKKSRSSTSSSRSGGSVSSYCRRLLGFTFAALAAFFLANAANLRSSPLGIDRAPDGSGRRLKLRRRTRPAQRLRCGPGQVEENPIRGRVSLLAGPAPRPPPDARPHPPLAGRETPASAGPPRGHSPRDTAL